MIKYIELDENGVYVLSKGTGTSLPDGMLELPAHIPFEHADAYYMDSGALTQRPMSPAPEPEGQGFIIKDVPAGTSVEVFDLLGEEQLYDGVIDTTQDVTLSLSDAGVYEVRVSAPLPAYPTKTMIEVE